MARNSGTGLNQMGLLDWALKGHFKKLRDSPRGRALARAFQESGFNDGSHEAFLRSAETYERFHRTINPTTPISDQEVREFTLNTSNSRYPILFNVALDYALNANSHDQLLEFYHRESHLVTDTGAYVDALFPDFLKSRGRTAGTLSEVRVFQTQMFVLITAVTNYLEPEL